MKPGIYVKATASKTIQKVLEVEAHEIIRGPFKRIKYAKKIASQFRKDRAIFDFMDGNGYTDVGPWFDKKTIEIFEVE